MSLRCLLFSSNKEMVEPIWEVLTELEIEGEFCESAVDAVGKVSTQLYQIVITDWDDQPEAAYLLKAARDLKAAQRPLILAMVGEDARLPEALQAGANSVLIKPIRAKQVRDTMTTACQLLKAKQRATAAQPSAGQTTATPEARAAAAAAGGSISPALAARSVGQMPENTFRAGEFLQSANSPPGLQFDTESGSDVQKSLDQAQLAEVDALTDLEPTAAAVQEAVVSSAAAEPMEDTEVRKPLTGWASLQERLEKAAPSKPVEQDSGNALLSYGDTPSYSGAAPKIEEGAFTHEAPAPTINAWQPPPPEAVSAVEEAADEPEQEIVKPQRPRSKRSRIVLAGIVAAGVVLAAVPQTRQNIRMLGALAVRAGGTWLNPPPAPLPKAEVLHDSFGQSGDEYKLPATANIPDATTDPSQIQVVPVVDPTAKPDKTADGSGGQSGENPDGQVKDAGSGSAAGVPAVAPAVPVAASEPPAAQVSSPAPQAAPPPARPAVVPQQVAAGGTLGPGALRTIGANGGIPSSLKSQMAPAAPAAGGAMPPEAAMSSIEPVNLPESAVLELLTEPVEAQYPAAAMATKQRGNVVLQVLIGRDGAVQDAKFLQGSLVFARAAIDAVKQWRFKPYSMNGRAVTVQSVITLNFKPPA